MKPDGFRAVSGLLLDSGAALTIRAAVALGDTDHIRQMRAEGLLVNSIEHWGGLLRIAIQHDRVDMLTLLLDLGLDPEERMAFEELEGSVQSWGMPLWHAAGTGRYEMAEIFLKRGADPNGKVYAGGTPVGSAYSRGDSKMVRLLRSFAGEIEPATIAHYRETELARKLLEDVDRRKLPRDTASASELVEELLWGGACGGGPEIVRMTLERIAWPHDDSRWYRILTQPIYFWNHMRGRWAHSDLDRATYLTCFELVLGRADVNLRSKFGTSVLHEIAAYRDYVTVEEATAFATAALDAGARLDCRDDLLQSTPLGWACRWGHSQMAELFLSRGASAEEPDAESWATPQAWAKKMGHDQVLELVTS